MSVRPGPLACLLPLALGLVLACEEPPDEPLPVSPSSAYVELNFADDVFYFFLQSEQEGLCERLELAYAGAASAVAAYGSASEEEGCNDFIYALSDAWTPMLTTSPTFFFGYLTDGELFDLFLPFEEVTQPRAGTFDLLSEEVFVQETEFGTPSVYQDAAERELGCGHVAIDEMDDFVLSRIGIEGTVLLEAEGEGGWSVESTATLEDEQGEALLDPSVTFSAEPCSIDASATSSGSIFNSWAMLPWAAP